MPRIYDEDNNALDFCKSCMPTKAEAISTYGKDADFDNTHPDYNGEDYTCESCGKTLTDKDN